MTSPVRQIYSLVEQLQPVYLPGEEPRVYAVMNDVPLTTNNGVSQEQQIVYYNTPVNYQNMNNPQPQVYPQQLVNNPIVYQRSSANLLAQQHQQQISSSSYIPSHLEQHSMKHSNMD